MLFLLACTCASEAPIAPVEGGELALVEAPPQPPPLPGGLQPLTEITIRNGQQLYQECLDRVEGPSQDGECTTDADCVRAGCSGEACVPDGTDLMTTCEIRLCFQALDSCGCVDGRCSWSLHPDGAVVPAWNFTGEPGLQPVER